MVQNSDEEQLIDSEEEQSSGSTEQMHEAYQCSCGYTSQHVKEFRAHVMRAALKDGKGTHKSLGRIDVRTGDVVAPPWIDRSTEERAKYKQMVQPEKRNSGTGSAKSPSTSTVKAEYLGQAQEIRVVPRIWTMDYSPIMRAAQDAATKYWGWRPDMPLGNFIDTCLYHFFEEKGITLCGYIVHESLLKKEAQHAS